MSFPVLLLAWKTIRATYIFTKPLVRPPYDVAMWNNKSVWDFLLFLIAFGTKSVETDRYKKRWPPDGMVLILMEYFIILSIRVELMKPWEDDHSKTNKTM